MPRIYRSQYWDVEHDILNGMILAVRSNVAFSDAADFERDLSKVTARFEKLNRPLLTFYCDQRLGRVVGPDSEYLAVFKRCVPRLIRGFRRTAMLVKTPVGKLQAARWNAEMGVSIAVFDDERAAMAYLLEG